jgi:hypothetical protein
VEQLTGQLASAEQELDRRADMTQQLAQAQKTRKEVKSCEIRRSLLLLCL